MKKRFTTLFLCTLFAISALAQKPTAVIKKASVDPVIDGVVDDVWTEATPNNVDNNFFGQVPTLGPSGSTTWQGLWTEDGMWVLVIVADDVFYPHYDVEPPGQTWQHDKPELYLDVNYILEDGGGPLPDWRGGGNGHYQIEPAFTDGSNDGTLLVDPRLGVVQYAFMVNDPDYIGEYFVPFSLLTDSEGGPVDLTGEIGFDVYVIDRDPGDTGERIAVWSNTGGEDGTQSSWGNMDGCGIITFEGAVAPVYIDEITLTGGEITENNSTLQIVAEVVPAENTETLRWSVADGNDGGRATIDNNGTITAVLNGTVTVTASSLYVDASVDVTISNQIVTMPEINLIRNGYFDQLDGIGNALEWSGNRPVIEGIVNLDPPEGGVNVWDYTMAQQTFGCNNTDMYMFSFVAWAADPDTFNVDFEDSNNAYNRYGTSTHEFSYGESDWTFVTETEPTKYVFDVIFNEKVENTIESLNFMLGWHDPMVYIDSVMLYREDDLALLSVDYVPVESIEVSGEGGATVVPIGSTLQMSAEVLPLGATLTGVNWSVVPGTGDATIDASGLLTGDTIGTVTVIASAKDDSKVWNGLEVYVSWPEGIAPNQVSTLSIFPNPAVNELNVVLSTPDARVSIYNSMGQKIDEVSVIGTGHIFDISGYASGLYFVRSGNTVVKFVK